MKISLMKDVNISEDVQEVNACRDMEEFDEDDVSDIDLSCLVNGYGVEIDARQLVGLANDVEFMTERSIQTQPDVVAVHSIYGSGANATVFGGTFQNRPAAIKVLKKQSEELEHCEAEAKYLRQFNHKNILKFYGTGYEHGKYYIAIERGCCDFVTLFNEREDSFTQYETAKFVKEILSGLSYLLRNFRMIHRDLKLENILLDSNHNVKICDFDHSIQLQDGERIKYVNNFGTTVYSPPECFDPAINSYGEKYDVYSVGVIYLILRREGRFPCEEGDEDKVDFKEVWNIIDDYQGNASIKNAEITIMKSLMQPVEKDRPTASQALTELDDLFSEILGNRLENYKYRVSQSILELPTLDDETESNLQQYSLDQIRHIDLDADDELEYLSAMEHVLQ